MNDLNDQFVTEARDLIQRATDDLIALERDGFAAERIDRVFRAFHTLKGSAGVVELPAMSLTLHAAEDLLAAIQAGRLSASPAIIDGALACLDQISQWVDAFEASNALPTNAGEDARAMAERLRDVLSQNVFKEPTKSEGRAPATDGGDALPTWISRLIESRRSEIASHLRSGPAHLFALSYEPHAGCFFDGVDPLRLMRQVPNLLAFHIEIREEWPPLAELDPYACNLRLQAISAANRSELSRVFRLMPDQVRIIDVPLAALPPERMIPADLGVTAGLVRTIVEEQRRVLSQFNQDGYFIGRFGAVTRAAANAYRHDMRPDLAELIERAGLKAISQASAAPLLSVLDECLGPVAAVSPSPVDENLNEIAGSPMDHVQHAASRSLRVDESKIDALVNLAGELVVFKNGFAHLVKQKENDAEGRDLARAARREYNAIERLTGEMYSAILRLRMVPVGLAFRPFPRLVRDISQRLGKKVALATRGEATESDKAIVDSLFEPLLHLVRNAIDHGIEPADRRRAVGKPETATITMQASRMGDRFVVDIVDDGRGIDPAMIRRRAAKRGVLTVDELAGLSDEQAVDLIFSAGFSTAAEVSDISGRGVGMDAVRAAVERVGGRVSLTSRVGAGTTVHLDLPTTIAMSRIMVVETGGQVFGIPMDAVVETVHLAPDRISKFKNNDGFVLRDRIVPICSLAQLMHLPERPASESDARLVVVTELNGTIIALGVDAIRDRLEVVLKPMQGVLANARGFSGTTLLGDGGVLLVLDLREILP
jgi:two-component system chemotaxis sensor kinase CheA